MLLEYLLFHTLGRVYQVEQTNGRIGLRPQNTVYPITDLVVPETLLYRTLPNLNCPYQPISPCYNGRTMYTGPDEVLQDT